MNKVFSFAKYYSVFIAGGFCIDWLGDDFMLRIYKRTESETTRAFIGHYRRWYYETQDWKSIVKAQLLLPYNVIKCYWTELPDDFKTATKNWDRLAEREEKERLNKE